MIHGTYLTVRPHEVEHGDLLAGVPLAERGPIESILFAATITDDGERGFWIYADAQGRELARRGIDGCLQVLRQDVEGEQGETIPRPLELMPARSPSATSRPGITRRHGMWAVQP